MGTTYIVMLIYFLLNLVDAYWLHFNIWVYFITTTIKMAWITEDDRVHISELMCDLLVSRKEEDIRNSFIGVIMYIHVSYSAYIIPVWCMYIMPNTCIYTTHCYMGLCVKLRRIYNRWFGFRAIPLSAKYADTHMHTWCS